MKKRGLFAILLGMAVMSFTLFNSCDVAIGLGAAVDTEAPSLTIETPPTAAVIREAFVISGTYSDDGEISGVSVDLQNTSDKTDQAFHYTGIIKKDNEWSVLIDPTKEKSKIPDGKYEATITISDNGGHRSVSTRSFVIDNTKPVIVLQRPKTIAEGNASDVFGQKFTLVGQAADNNDIALIRINFYADKECKTEPLHHVDLKNVPPTIDMDVATFKLDEENDYFKIYRSTKKDGKRPVYFKIEAYDGSRRYTGLKEEDVPEDDKLGNVANYYYLYSDEDVYKLVSEYKATGLYNILSGTYNTTDSSRKITDIEEINVRAILNANRISEGQFTLNPANNPEYKVVGRGTLIKDADGKIDFSKPTNGLLNESNISLKVAEGLDSIPIVESSLKIYLLPCDDEGKVAADANDYDIEQNAEGKTVRVYKNRIYPSADSVTSEPSDGGYTFTAKLVAEECVNYKNDKVPLKINGTYLIGIEGYDQEDNEVVAEDGNLYGFKLTPNGVAPIVEVDLQNTIYNGTNLIIPAISIQSTHGPFTLHRDVFDSVDSPIAGLSKTFTKDDVGMEALNNENPELEDSISISSKITTSGKYKIVYTVEDKNGKEGKTTKNITVDLTSPQIKKIQISGADYNSSNWYNSKTLSVSVNANDIANETGIDTVSYSTNGTLWTALSYDSEAQMYSGSAVFNNEGSTNSLYIRAKDKAGNVIYYDSTTENGILELTSVNVKIDSSAPNVGNTFFYQLEDMAAKEANGQIYVDGTKDLIVYGKSYDAESGLDTSSPLSFMIGESPVTPVSISYATSEPAVTSNMTSLTYAASPTDTKTIKYWKATFAKNSINSTDKCGTLKVTVKNIAGESSSAASIFNITFDNAKPVLSNIAFVSSKSKNQVYKKSDSEYFVNNKAGNPTFKLSGIATDNCGVNDVTFTIGGTNIPRTSTSLSEWVFDNIDLSSYTENEVPEAVITVYDLTGNSESKQFTIKFDVTEPKAMHWADAKHKDIYFRIGSADNDKNANSTQWETGDSLDNQNDATNKDVGKKYSFGSWGNDSTIEIRGNFFEAESGSGLKAIHYAIFDEAPTADQISKLLAGTLTVTGAVKAVKSFSPLTVPETKKVPYNKADGGKAAKYVTSNYRATLSGFDANSNYLVLVAEDNVGNRALDTLAVTEGDALGSSNWNSTDHETSNAYYNINKDTQAPLITSNAVNLYTNGKGNNIEVAGTASDELSGISDVTITIEELNYSQKATLTEGNWSAAIPVSYFNSDDISSGASYTVYAKATDNAGVGNSKQISAGTVIVDKTAPSVKINTSSNITSDKITLSRTVNDGTGAGLSTDNLILYYTKSETLGTVTEEPVSLTIGTTSADAATKWVKLTELSSVADLSLSDLDITTITNEDANTRLYFTLSAKDAAGTGNTGYAKPCTVLVDRKKPILKDSESGIGEKNGVSAINNFWFNSKTLRLEGEYSDVAGSGVTTISYNINNATKNTNIQTTDGTYSINISDFVDGPNTLKIWATDKVGNISAETTYAFNVDSISPVITSVAGDETTKTTDVNLTINITDKNPLTPEVKIKRANSVNYLATLSATTPEGSDSTYTSTVVVPFASVITEDGIYDVDISVKDKAGNSASIFTKRIVRDHEKPTITITNPANASAGFTKYSNYKFEGTITDETCGIAQATATLCTVTGTGESAVYSTVGDTENISLGADGHWVFQAYELGAADYVVKINATDIAGNVAVEKISPRVKIDSEAPVVTVSATTLNDAEGNSVSSLSNGVTYYTKENYSFNVIVNDINYEYAATGTFAGLTTITATDSNNENQNLTITANQENGRTTLTITPSNNSDGLFTYSIEIKDKANNAANKIIIKVQRDSTGPTVSIKNPAADITDPAKSLDDENYSFRINASDGIGVGVVKLFYAFTQTGSEPVANSSSWVEKQFTDGDMILEMPLIAGTTPATDENNKITSLCEGNWYLYAKAVDKSGNASAVVTRAFIIDKAAPAVTANAPEYVRYTTNTDHSRKVTISGTVTETNGLASFYIKRNDETGNGTPITPAENGNWTYEDTPAENGTYTYTIKATDVVERTNARLEKTVIVDTDIPTVSNIADNFTVPTESQSESSIFKFQGAADSVSDRGSGLDKVDLLFTDTDATLDAAVTAQTSVTPAANGSWASTVEFANDAFGTIFSSEGTKYLWVRAYDKAENTSGWRQAKSFIYDTAVPSISFTAAAENKNPETGSYRNSGFTLEVEATDSNGVQKVEIFKVVNSTETLLCEVNGSGGIYSKSFVVGTANAGSANYLADGTYNFMIKVTDLANKTKSVTRTVTIDTTKPEGIFGTTTPSGNDVESRSWYKVSSIRFAVNVTEANIATVEIKKDDSAYESMSGSSGSYAANVTGLAEGSNTVTVKMTDLAGNDNTVSKTVYVDTTEPTLSPAESSILKYMGTNGFTVTGSAEDVGSEIASLVIKEEFKASNSSSFAETAESVNSNEPVTVTIDNDGNWSKSLPLGTIATSGQYRYTLTLKDNAGNEKSYQFTTTVDQTAPTLSFTNPTGKTETNAINASPYMFSGNVGEANEIKAIYYKVLSDTAPAPTAPANVISATAWTGWTSVTPEENWSFYRDIKTGTNAVAEGKHKIYMYVLDGAGNLSDADSTTTGQQPYTQEFHVDMSAPVITTKIGSDPITTNTKQVKTSNYTFKFKPYDSYELATTTPYTITVKKNSTPLIEGENGYSISEADSDGFYTVTITGTAAGDGTYEYSITAKDWAGKTTTETRIVQLDTQAPVLAVITPALSNTTYQNSKDLTISGSTTDESGTSAVYYKYSSESTTPEVPAANTTSAEPWKGSGWSVASGTTSWTINNITGVEGSVRYLYLAAVDTNGLVSNVTTGYVKVDTANPTSITTTSSLVTNETVTLTGTVWDANAIKKITISDGTHTYSTDDETTTISLSETPGTLADAVSEESKVTWTKTFAVGSASGALPDSKYTFTITVEDNAGKTTINTREVTIDTTKPVISSKSVNTEQNEGISVAYDDGTNKWYKTNQIPVKVTMGTDLSEISSVQISTDGANFTNPTSLIPSGSIWKGNIVCENQGLNTIYIKATDKAGNSNFINTSNSIQVYVDTKAPLAPVFLGAGTDENNIVSANNITSLLVNPTLNKPVIVYAALKDYGTTTNSTGITVSKVFKQKDKNGTPDSVNSSDLPPSITLPESVTNDYKILKYTIPTTDMIDGGIYFTVKDNAENEADYLLFQMTLDQTQPSVEIKSFTKPGSRTNVGTEEEPELIYDVNGTITISGSASDGNKLESVILEYSEDGSAWTEVLQTSESTPNSWIAELNTAGLTDNTKYTLKATATDAAGNTKSHTQVIYVNQDTDRPVIKLMSLVLPEEEQDTPISYQNSELTGIISDDDGIPSALAYRIGATGSFIDSTKADSKLSYSSNDGQFTLELDDAEASEVYFKITTQEKDSDNKFVTFETKLNPTDLELQTTPKLTDKNSTKYGYKTDAVQAGTALTLRIDTTPPAVEPVGYSVDASVDGKTWPINVSSQTFGGTHSTFYLNQFVYDKVKIDSVKVEIAEVTGDKEESKYSYIFHPQTEEDSEDKITKTINNVPYEEWRSEEIDVAGLVSGTREFTVKVSDGVSTTTSRVNINIDNTASVISFTGPSSTTTSSGSITAYGTVDSDSDVYYAISTSETVKPGNSVKTWTGETSSGTSTSGSISDIKDKDGAKYQKINDASLSWFVYFDGLTTNGTHAPVLNDYLTAYGITTAEDLAKTDGAFDSIVNLYVWIKSVDRVGNESETCHLIKLDPQGDRPTVAVSYPNEDGQTLGGTVRVTGSANDEKGTSNEKIGVDSVWVQLISKKHNDIKSGQNVTYDVSGKTFGSFTAGADNLITPSTFSMTKDDLDYLYYAGYPVKKMLDKSAYNPDATEVTPSDYAILATLSGSSWSITLNNKGEFNPASGTNGLAMRVYAKDKDGKLSVNTDKYMVYDSSNPIIGSSQALYLVKSEDNSLEISNSVPYFKDTASREYIENMFIKGDWWLIGSVEDNDAIKTLRIGSDRLIKDGEIQTSNNWKVIGAGDSVSKSNLPTEDDPSVKTGTISVYKTVYFKYKLTSTKQVDSLSHIIQAIDAAEGTPGHTDKSIHVNVDNVAPVLAGADNSGYKLDPNIHQEEGFYYMESMVSEPVVGTNSQSELDSLAFFFMRRNITGASEVDKIYNPMIKGGKPVSITNSLHYEDGLYWKTVTVGRSDDLHILTGVTEDSNIRVNGLVKIGGSVYKITEIDGTSVTINGNPKKSADNETAYFAYALTIDNTIQESGSTTTKSTADGYLYPETITNDDGDGFVEYIKKTGTNFYWSASIVSSNIPDGPIELHYVAFDKAGNYSIGIMGNMAESVFASTSDTTYTQTADRSNYQTLKANNSINVLYVDADNSTYNGTASSKNNYHDANLAKAAFISNNAPRLAGVQVGLDINSNNVIDDDEWAPRFAAKNNSSNLVTLVGENGAAYKTVKGKTAIKPEIIGGNGSVYYSYAMGAKDGTQSAVEAIAEANRTKVTSPIVGNGSLDGSVDVLAITDGIVLQPGDFIRLANTKGDDKYYCPDGNYWFNFKLWDSTDATKAFENSQNAQISVLLDLNLNDVNEPTVTLNEPLALTNQGHVDSSESWMAGPGYNGKERGKTGFTASQYDSDPKVSGKIVITGTLKDDVVLHNVYLESNAFTGLNTKIVAASYDSTKTLSESVTTRWTVSNSLPDGVSLELGEDLFDEQGHEVSYTLTIDTAKSTGIAMKDVVVEISADDYGKPTLASLENLTVTDGIYAYTVNQKENTSETNSQYMDIVPYITGIWRSATTKSVVTKTYRSTYGEYPVAIGDTLTVTGYNLPNGDVAADATNTFVQVGSHKVATTNKTAKESFTFAVPERSGELCVTVNGIISLNDKNNNANESNQESANSATNNAKSSTVEGNMLYDNRYLRVWDVGHYFSNSEGGNIPTMAADKTGNLFTTWTLMGTGSVQMQRGLNTVNKPVYIGYDQPDKETSLAVDKSSAAGNLSVLCFPANVGSSGTPDSTGYADAQTLGGVWGLNLYNDFANSANYSLTSGNKHLALKDNPYYVLDSKIGSAGYQLVGASMRREVSQFKNGHTVRYGDNMHFVYYDSYNKALRYTFQKAGKKISSDDPLNTNGNYNNSDNQGNNTPNRKDIVGWILIDGKTDPQDRIHRWTGNDKEYIWSNNNGGVDALTTVNGTIGDNGKSISITGNWTGAKAVGISYIDESAVYKIFVTDVTESTGNGKTTYTWAGEFPKNSEGKYYTPTGLAVYKGDSNVVSGGNGTQAGSYSGIDVTSTGKPVIVYYDMQNETLRIAYSSTETPNMYSATDGAGKFTIQSLSSIVSGGTHVQAKIDGNNYLHILYRDSEGQLCYLKSSNNPDGEAYTFSQNYVKVVDTAGTYGTLSLIRSGTETYTYTPCVSFLNSEGSANGVKYAVLRNVNTGNKTSESLWDVMIVPAVSGNYVTGGEYIYTEGYNGWTANSADITDNVNTANCDAIVGYNTGRMDVVFLKSE